MRKTLSSRFLNRPTLKIARELLGKFLVRRVVEVRPALRAKKNKPNFHYPVRKIGGKIISGMITEIEAYISPEDKASHASKGKTKRTEVMFGKPGIWYVYLVYGMHHCLNIVTEREGYPAAILIRSVSVNTTNKRSLVSCICRNCLIKGPGKVCRYFHIDRSLNQKPAAKKSGLWIEDRGVKIKASQIASGKRIGVEYAGGWKDKLWRLYLASDVNTAY